MDLGSKCKVACGSKFMLNFQKQVLNGSKCMSVAKKINRHDSIKRTSETVQCLMDF